MKKNFLVIALLVTGSFVSGQDWTNVPIPVNAGAGKVWQLQTQSDDFNYTAPADNKGTEFFSKWTDFYHNAWTGPSPTVWRNDHSYVEGGLLKIKASRPSGTTTTNTGCITSKQRVIYPAYIEASVKITNSVLASDVWMLSADDTQEIDICEAYGSDRWTNEWFSSKRIHLSHHVFIRSPFQDWQPNDEGSFYTNGSTVWRNDYHRIGVYWKDPWNLEYYVDGVKVRTRSGVSQIDPNNFTGGTGLSKEMDIIINTEDQTWRANQGLTPTEAELAVIDNNTFKVDWIRVYKLVDIPTSVKNIKSANLKISPNPFTNNIQINSEENFKRLLICQMTGAVIKTELVNGPYASLSTDDLISGVYILKVQYENGTISSEKIIKL